MTSDVWLGGGRGSEGRRGRTGSGMGERSAARRRSNQNFGKRARRKIQRAARKESKPGSPSHPPQADTSAADRPATHEADGTKKLASEKEAWRLSWRERKRQSSERTQPPNENKISDSGRGRALIAGKCGSMGKEIAGRSAVRCIAWLGLAR